MISLSKQLELDRPQHKLDISVRYLSFFKTFILQRFHLWSLKWVLCKMSHKKFPLGRKSKSLSICRVGLAVCMEMERMLGNVAI